MAHKAFWFLICVSIALLPHVSYTDMQTGLFATGAETPAAGKFLVARRDMPDPRFRSTVVLLLRHDAGGSLGLIVNRRTSVSLAHLEPDMEGIDNSEQRLFYGGPVAPKSIIYLTRSDTPPPDAEPVISGVYVGITKQRLESMLKEGKTMAELRLYFGHAGWAPGQLDNELKRRDWYVFDADADAVFSSAEEGLWERYIRERDPAEMMAAHSQCVWTSPSTNAQTNL